MVCIAVLFVLLDTFVHAYAPRWKTCVNYELNRQKRSEQYLLLMAYKRSKTIKPLPNILRNISLVFSFIIVLSRTAFTERNCTWVDSGDVAVENNVSTSLCNQKQKPRVWTIPKFFFPFQSQKVKIIDEIFQR